MIEGVSRMGVPLPIRLWDRRNDAWRQGMRGDRAQTIARKTGLPRTDAVAPSAQDALGQPKMPGQLAFPLAMLPGMSRSQSSRARRLAFRYSLPSCRYHASGMVGAR